MSAPQIAVVIATYKRPDLLARCLNALFRQTLPAALYEIVVVDDGRDERTRAVVSSFQRPDGPRICYTRPDGTRGPAAARNKGWRSTHAPVIAFTDDDTEPAGDWLEEGLKAMTSDVVGVGGKVVVPISAAPTDHERNTQGLEQAEYATANAFARRAALEAIGGFDERFTRAWREDSDLHFSLMQRCGPVRWAPRAVVVHPVRTVPWGFSLRQQANVYFDALLFKKHPQLYRLKIKPNPPWHYYLIVGCTVLALLSLLGGATKLAMLMALAAFVGVLDFCLMRLRGTARTPQHVAEMIVTSMAIPYLAVYWRIRGALDFKVVFL